MEALQREGGKGGVREILVDEGRRHLDILDGESLGAAMEKQVECVWKVILNSKVSNNYSTGFIILLA